MQFAYKPSSIALFFVEKDRYGDGEKRKESERNRVPITRIYMIIRFLMK